MAGRADGKTFAGLGFLAVLADNACDVSFGLAILLSTVLLALGISYHFKPKISGVEDELEVQTYKL